MKILEDYTDKAIEVHGNKYKYIALIKINNYPYLKIECPIHGEFEKRATNHILKKQGCSLCSKPNKLTTELFIIKANKKHNNKYDYSKVIYVNGKNKVTITCDEHGDFEQTPTNHLNGQNCPKCSFNTKVSLDDFVKRSKYIHGDKYDYSEVVFITMTEPVKIICKIHGVFEQKPRNHLDSNGCYKCSGITKNTEDFINNSTIIHGVLYDYSKVDYINTRKQVIIVCKKHGEFKQTPNDHLSGYGCTKCGKGNYSKICIEWLDGISKKENINIQHISNGGEKNIKINGKKYKLDGYHAETNTVYEFYGDLWHGNLNKFKRNDINPINKKKYGDLYDETIKREIELKNAGFNIITIWESDYKKMNKI
jgi:hypothetical protein